MRLYMEHRMRYLRYRQARAKFEEILDEYEEILQMVQPKSALAEHEREHMPSVVPVSGGMLASKTETYVVALDESKIEERLAAARSLMTARAQLLESTENELRKSKDIYNMIYTAKWVDGLKTGMIVEQTGYSKSQVYSIIEYLSRQVGEDEQIRKC